MLLEGFPHQGHELRGREAEVEGVGDHAIDERLHLLAAIGERHGRPPRRHHHPAAAVAGEHAIALRHHERFDGSGYPDGIAGSAIPLYARIAAVADVFDALTSHRAHRPAIDPDRALDYVLSQRGKHFDPGCVDAFISEERRIRDIRVRYRDVADDPLTGS